MNCNRYRVVFNKVRGQLMAVAETANGHGKGSHGERATTAPALPGCLAHYKPVALALWLAVGALHSAWAQIIADPTAPASQRPTILLDSTGRPLINIQTPSAGGISRNTYKQFDVQSNGIVLNNQRASNPWLATGEAKVILNEINSSNPSYLNGAITVNGATAQVVIANPSGLKIDGASFINASRATLTTGSPVLSNGQLTGLNVSQGSVDITGKGLSAVGTSYTDILTRAASIAGRVDANEISITTGTQTVDYATGQLTALTGTGTKPIIAIDTAALGGMYAGKITLLATEAGVGVRNAGTLQANATTGQLIITADGRLENSGRMDGAVTSAATITGSIDNRGTLLGRNLLMISAGTDFNQSGVGINQGVTTASTVLVNAQHDVNLAANALIASNGIGGQVGVSAGNNINLAAGSGVSAHGDVQLSSDGQIIATNAAVRSTTIDATAVAAQGMTLTNTTVTGQHVHLETGAPFQQTSSNIAITGGQINGTQQTAVIATGDILINSPATAAVSSSGNVYLDAAKNLTLTAGSLATAGNHFTAIAGEALQLQGISGNTATNGSKVSITATGDVRLAGGNVFLHGSRVTAGGAMAIEANKTDALLYALPNAGQAAHDRVLLSAGKDLTVSAYKGNIFTKAIDASAENIHVISNGTTSIGHALNMTLLAETAVGSILNARADMTIGSISADRSVEVIGSALNAGGQAKIISNGNVLLYSATNKFTVAGSPNPTYTSTRPTITAASVNVQGGSIYTQAANIRATSGHISLAATSGNAVLNTHYGNRTELNSAGNTSIHANQLLNLSYTTANAGGSMATTSANGTIESIGSTLIATDMLSLSSKGGQTHSSGFYDGGALSVYNQSGTLTLNNTRLQTRATLNAAISNLSGKLSVESGAGMSTDANSVLSATTDLSIVTGSGDITINPVGSARSGTGLVLSPNQIGAGRDLTIAARNGNLALTGSAGANGWGSSQRVILGANGNINLFGNSVTLQGSEIRSNTGTISITSTLGGTNFIANKVTAFENGFINTYWDRAVLAASRGLDIRSAGDINIDGLWAHTWGNASFLSGGNITTSGKYNQWRIDERPSNGWYRDEEYLTKTEITGEQGVAIGAVGGRLLLNGSNVRSSAGAVNLQALGDVVLEAALEDTLHQATSSGWSESCFFFICQKTTWTTYRNRAWRTVNPVILSGRDINIKAGNNVLTYATSFNAFNNLRIEAGVDALYYAVKNETDSSDTTYETKSFIGIRYDKSTEFSSNKISTPKVTQLQSRGSIQSLSGGDQLLQGTKVIYGSSAVFQPNVGEKARADARIILEGVNTTVTQSRTKESNYVLWQRQAGSGSTVETLTLPSFSGPTAPVLKGPVLAQIPAGDFKTQIQSLSQQPGMTYLQELATRTDVNWQPVKLAYDQWSYDQQGLTPAGAALVSVAVAWATGGAGAGLVGASTGSTSALMANAAFTSLASQASITLINNKGDIGKTLKDLGRSSAVKATLAAALTAGALAQISTLPGMTTLSQSTEFTDKLTANLVNAGGRALTNTAINGGSLEDALKGAMIGAVVDTAHGAVASEIKGLESDYLAHKLAHALAGCVAGAAAQGTCKDGAIGAAVGEIVVQLMPPSDKKAGYTETEKLKALNYSKLIAGAVAAYAGGNAQTAITTAETAVKNNGLMELINPRPVQKKTFTTVDKENAVVEKTAAIDAERQRITLIQPAETMLYAAGTGGAQVNGYTVIFAHASDGTIQGVDPNKADSWNAFIDMIKTSGAWKPGQPILLDACNTGKIDTGVASALAKSLNTYVTGATTQTWNIPAYSTSGITGAYDKLTDNIPNLAKPGLWKTFSPDGVLTGVTIQMPKPSSLTK